MLCCLLIIRGISRRFQDRDVWTNKVSFGPNESSTSRLYKTGKDYIYGTINVSDLEGEEVRRTSLFLRDVIKTGWHC